MKINFIEIGSESFDDKATGGKCFYACLRNIDYINLIKSIYKEPDDFQREIINITKSKVYSKLVKDLIKGVVIPTISLFFENTVKIQDDMEIESSNIRILDGLQRTNCLIAAHNELLKTQSNIHFEDIAKPLTLEEFENRLIRLEIWTDLTVNGILYKMVSLNAGQTPMRIEHQFEVLELPLSKELHEKGVYNIKRAYENHKPVESFYLSSIVEAAIAYNFETIIPKKQEMAISFLDKLDISKGKHESLFLKNAEFMNDLVWVLRDLHNKQIQVYNSEEEFKGIFSNQDSFLIPFMAAFGKARVDENVVGLVDKKKLILMELMNSKPDPLSLQEYKLITLSFKSGIGNKIRRLVHTAFVSFFLNEYMNKIDWKFANNLI